MEDEYFDNVVPGESDGNIDIPESDIDQLGAELLDAGYDPADVEEFLYDPAPRRRGRKGKSVAKRTYRAKRSTRRYARSYDPAPRRRKTGGRKKPRGILAKVKKFAFPGAAGITFYSSYLKRADELFTAGLITQKSVFSAIEYDVKNFDANAAMDRLKVAAPKIVVPSLVGVVVKETKIAGKYSGLVKDLMVGMAAGTAAKAALDPPLNQTSIKQVPTSGTIRHVSTTHTQTESVPAPAQAPQYYNPYM